MSETAVAERHDLDDATILRLVSDGDCSKLSPDQRLQYYRARCDAAGLDYRAQPFQFINLSGKLVLYALKAATDQLTAAHRVAVSILDQRTEDGVRVVTVRACTPDGRSTDEIGAVSVANLKGDALCNALMKATTKAKRRAVLSICGLGLLDETELETCVATPAAAPAAVAAPAAPRHLADLAPKPAAAKVKAPPPTYGEDEYQEVRIGKVFRDLKSGEKNGKSWSFTKYAAITDGGVRLTTIKDDIGTLLQEGQTVSVVIDPEEKWKAHEILAIRESLSPEEWEQGWDAVAE